MKLFITNKQHFEETFQGSADGYYLTAKEIHKKAYNELAASLANHAIPLVLFPRYKDDGNVIFDFVSKKDDVYYYVFTTTAS